MGCFFLSSVITIFPLSFPPLSTGHSSPLSFFSFFHLSNIVLDIQSPIIKEEKNMKKFIYEIKILERWKKEKNDKGEEWPVDKGGKERGKDYNHSTFCDLIINGLIGNS